MPCFLLRFFGPGATGAVGPPPLRFASHSVLYVAAFVLYWNKGAARPQPMAQSEGGWVAAGVWGGGLFQGVPNGKGTTWSLPVVA